MWVHAELIGSRIHIRAVMVFRRRSLKLLGRMLYGFGLSLRYSETGIFDRSWLIPLLILLGRCFISGAPFGLCELL